MQWNVGINPDWPNATALEYTLFDDEPTARRFIEDYLNAHYPAHWQPNGDWQFLWSPSFGVLTRPGHPDMCLANICRQPSKAEWRTQRIDDLTKQAADCRKLLTTIEAEITKLRYAPDTETDSL